MGKAISLIIEQVKPGYEQAHHVIANQAKAKIHSTDVPHFILFVLAIRIQFRTPEELIPRGLIVWGSCWPAICLPA